MVDGSRKQGFLRESELGTPPGKKGGRGSQSIAPARGTEDSRQGCAADRSGAETERGLRCAALWEGTLTPEGSRVRVSDQCTGEPAAHPNRPAQTRDAHATAWNKDRDRGDHARPRIVT